MEEQVELGRLSPKLVDVVRDLLRQVVAANPGVAVRVESLEEAGVASANYGLLITAVDCGIEIRVDVLDDLKVSVGASANEDVAGAEFLLPLASTFAQLVERSVAITMAVSKRVEAV